MQAGLTGVDLGAVAGIVDDNMGGRRLDGFDASGLTSGTRAQGIGFG